MTPDMLQARPAPTLLTDLRAEHPEWSTYLVLVGLALDEARAPVWSEAVPRRDPPIPGRPLLAGAAVHIARRPVERWVRDVLRLAADESEPARPLARAVVGGRVDAIRLFAAALAGAAESLADLSLEATTDPGVLQSLAPLIGMPLLQACGRAWADRLPVPWGRGFCPVCGAWPTLAEIRGLESSRRLRCGQCGSDWEAEWLNCPFCGMDDHTRLGSLVLPDRCETRRVDVCHACWGYLKTITTLAPMAAHEVLLRDLATLALDLTAMERGYRRPPRPSQMPVRIALVPTRLARLLRVRP